MAMGIYDREYYRRGSSGLLDPFARTGQVCKWLLLINIGAFVLQLLTMHQGVAGPFTDTFILDTEKVFSGQVWRLLTYAFLHDPTSLLHLVFNMLFLWWFGSELEGLYGPREFLTFYLVAAVLGGVAFQAYAGATDAPLRCLGASGAVTAVMVLFACHFPHRIILLFFILPVPVWALVAFQVLMDSFYFVSEMQGRGVRTQTAVVVHLAGAAFAFAYYKMQWRVAPLWTWLLTRRGQTARPRLRVFHGEEEEPGEAVPVGPPPAQGVDEQLEAKLDAVLEKVARSGQASLTESEREILFRASEIYKRRRT
jgi:membrane associated rhomboid family serine protease